MPSTSCGFSSPYQLASHGPTISVEIGYDRNFRPGAGARPKLPANRYPALVDTGAIETCVDVELAMALALPVAGRGPISGVSGVIETDDYMAQIHIPELNFTLTGPFAGVRIRAGGHPFYALLGRTFLRHFSMHYDGRTGAVIISND